MPPDAPTVRIAPKAIIVPPPLNMKPYRNRGKPIIKEVYVGLEINCYDCAEI